MGLDKEATDIWKFGKSRPDLSLDETMAAPMPSLSATEEAQRQALLDARLKEKLAPMIGMARAMAIVRPKPI